MCCEEFWDGGGEVGEVGGYLIVVEGRVGGGFELGH